MDLFPITMSQLPDHLARFQKINSLVLDDILGVDDLLCMEEHVPNQERLRKAQMRV
jgi:hypothetical protein